MAKTIIGKVGMTLKRQWDSTTAYVRLDTVTHEGRSYAALKDNIGVEPTLESEVWQLLADKGHFTEQDKEAFKQAVVEESKAEINEHTDNKKTELDNYTSNFETSLKNELDTYTKTKQTELDTKRTELETEMTNTKDNLVEEITNAQNGFDDNVTAKTTAFNNNVTEKTNTFNSNAETKTEDFDTNANTKKTEFNNNSTAKLEEYNNNSATKLEEYNSNDTAKLEAYNSNAIDKTNSFNSNAEEKTAEFNENAESYKKRISELETEVDELSQQMPWRTTDISSNIHVEDAAKFGRNRLPPLGNMEQETRKGINYIDIYNQHSINSSATSNGVKFTFNEDGSITINGTATASGGVTLVSKEDSPFLLQTGDYTAYVRKSGNVTGLSYIRFLSENENLGNSYVDLTSNAYKVFSISEDFNLEYIKITFSTGTVFENFKIYPMLVKGNYTITDYPPFEQYGAMPSLEYPSPIQVATGVQKIRRCGRNLCNAINQNYFLSNDVKTCGIYANNNGLIINVEEGQYYTISTLVVQERYRIACLNDMPLNSTGITAYQGKNQDNTDNSITINTAGYKYLVINATDLTLIQIEQGDTETDYEPYSGEDITLDLDTTELAKIVDANGNVLAQDKAVYREVGGVWKWQWEKNVLKAIMTTTDAFTINSYSNTSKRIQFVSTVFQNIPSNLSEKETEIETRYNYIKPHSTTSTSKFRFFINYDDIGLETFISNTDARNRLINLIQEKGDAVIYYVATEPLYEDCTAEQSATLDKLYKLSLEKGTNNIFIESENGVTAELQLTYMQDSNLLREQEHKQFEDRLTAVENLLSTTATSAMLLDNLQDDLESEVK